MKRLLFTILCIVLGSEVVIADVVPNREVVVLVHGLARSSRSMKPMEKALTAAGYTVYSMKYPSTEKTVQELADEYLAPLVLQCQAAKPVKIHFVAHSLGNIVLRYYFSVHKLENTGRIVMLGPPNRGSEVVDRLGRFTLFKWINGPAGQQLGTFTNSLPNRLPLPPAEVGVIAGTRSINLFLSMLIPGPDDGKVSVERAKIKGMKDFVTVAASHPFLMRNREVIDLTLSFLQDGHFETRKSNKGSDTYFLKAADGLWKTVSIGVLCVKEKIRDLFLE
jgi:pimeloyl-ACP methyl ester carboxylesterase